jgi:hypothetical protein
MAIVLAAFCLPYAALSVPAQKSQKPLQEIRYTLREYNGELALFREDEPVPCALYDVPVDLLPEVDRVQLRSGISVSGDDELRRMLEDYTS